VGDRLSWVQEDGYHATDVFALPFDEIAPIVGRSQAATRQLASQARRRVRGEATSPVAELARQREVVDAFLAAARDGNFGTLVAVLDPEVVLRADRPAVIAGASTEVRGAREVARRAVEGGARAARPALVDGAVGVVVAPRGRLLMVLRFRVRDGKIVEIDAIADPARLRQLDLTVLDD
jgi:RNA polymerase sigma-70 factor, ECF subfamily